MAQHPEARVEISVAHRAATVFESALREATVESDDQLNPGARGAVLFLDITAEDGTSPTLDVKLQAKDPLTGKYVDIVGAAFAQKNDVGVDTLVVYPGIAGEANRRVSDVLPSTWRAVATIGGTSPEFTFSLSAAYIA
jgi:hypothetical protein